MLEVWREIHFTLIHWTQDLANRATLFKEWVTLSIEQITLHWTAYGLFCQQYSEDTVIHSLNDSSNELNEALWKAPPLKKAPLLCPLEIEFLNIVKITKIPQLKGR